MNIAIYMEGGGDGKDSKAALRQGMDGFLAPIKDAFRARGWHWKLVPCGSRNEAHKRFQNARTNGEPGIVVLLVDSEAPVSTGPVDHLTIRDGWNLQAVDSETVHLMVQTMETWIVADEEALRGCYGQGLRASALPRYVNLEEARKQRIAESLTRATENTERTVP